jgi:hypothetical protein
MLWRNLGVDVMPGLEELGIGLVSYMPLGEGFLTGTMNEDTPSPARITPAAYFVPLQATILLLRVIYYSFSAISRCKSLVIAATESLGRTIRRASPLRSKTYTALL